MVYQDLGESAVALEWLKKSLDAGVPVATVLDMPPFDALKNDRRFLALVQGPNPVIQILGLYEL